MCLRFFALLLFAFGLAACSNSAASSGPPPAPALESSSSSQPENPTKLSFEHPPSIPDLATGKARPPSQEEFGQQLGQATRKWFYGGGIGRTELNIGAIILFPPYILYLLGNASLALAGYEPLYITNLLPEVPRGYVLFVYNGVTFVPGRLNALVAGEEFQGE